MIDANRFDCYISGNKDDYLSLLHMRET